jgi:hypothetical protein
VGGGALNLLVSSIHKDGLLGWLVNVNQSRKGSLVEHKQIVKVHQTNLSSVYNWGPVNLTVNFVSLSIVKSELSYSQHVRTVTAILLIGELSLLTVFGSSSVGSLARGWVINHNIVLLEGIGSRNGIQFPKTMP